ncbi:MAG: indolepyruvate ferredoxin oxidoreductase, partial [Alistipes sp.]|nr:indolepyruvate ferredoxin oxidoreductase [Alistipes sp.]
MRKLLLGDEAIAQAAIDSGLSGVYAYPGTPSTEITEFIQLREEKRGDAQDKIFCRWSTNEKTAMEGALGMSYMGKRALVCMKHVGMNVAADPFVNSAMTGVNGGLVVVAADDPSMHSSQNEQDSRFYGKFALMPIFEPSSQQEAYEMTRAAFELSEAVKLPVLMRVTTRMAHSRAVVEITENPRKQNEICRPEDVRRWILLPAFAKKRYVELLAQQDDLLKASTESAFNWYKKGTAPERGVITT